MRNNIVDYLHLVQKPSRYTGGEIGTIVKPASEIDITFALVFPDVYELGVSNLGLRILYSILNNMKGVQSERVYSPWTDMEEIMRKEKIPPYGLETGMPLAQFDIIGFSLQYELLYTNILNLLALSKLPLKASERDEKYPLIIGGGPCAYNPEPMADFFDAFFIGDGEESVADLIHVYRNWKKEKTGGKKDLLESVAGIDGVYVPSFYRADYNDDGTVKSLTALNGKVKPNVRRRFIFSLEDSFNPSKTIIPSCEAVHDRVNIEISRGCSAGCRFCQAGIIYRPVRERSAESVIKLAREGIDETGYDEVSLTSLNVADHPDIEAMVSSLIKMLEKKRVSISLPSLRVTLLKNGKIAEEIAKVRKTGFTIAPEAGSQRLRDVINKGITEDEILQAAESAFSKGWLALKLYFMIGLPTETDSDVEEIVLLVNKIIERIRSKGRRLKRLVVSISTFVPKSHTPFQWVPMDTKKEIERKIRMLQSMFKSRFVELEWHDPDTSILEAVMARGDRRVGDAILNAFQKGAKFDGWRDCFNPGLWEKAFNDTGLDVRHYIHRERRNDEIFPWDYIDCGVKKEFLREEYLTALRGEKKEDCRFGSCHNCGLERVCSEVKGNRADNTCNLTAEYAGERIEAAESQPPVCVCLCAPLRRQVHRTDRYESICYRLKYSKKGAMRFISHREFQKIFKMTITRAHLPVAYSKGFNPHPIVSYGMPLSVGIESECEYADIELVSRVPESEITERLNNVFPEGLCVLETTARQSKKPSIQSSIRKFIYEAAFSLSYLEKENISAGILKEKISLFEKSDDSVVFRDKGNLSARVAHAQAGRSSSIDIKPYVTFYEFVHGSEEYPLTIRVDVGVINGLAPAIFQILDKVFNFRGSIPVGISIVRKNIELEQECFKSGC